MTFKNTGTSDKPKIVLTRLFQGGAHSAGDKVHNYIDVDHPIEIGRLFETKGGTTTFLGSGTGRQESMFPKRFPNVSWHGRDVTTL